MPISKNRIRTKLMVSLDYSSATGAVHRFSTRSLAMAVMTSCVLLIGSPFSVSARAETRDADNITLPEITTGLKENEGRIESLRVEYLIKTTLNFVKPGEEIQKGIIEDDAVSSRRTGKVFWEALRDGRGRAESRHSRVNARFDGSTVQKRDRFVSVFDGLYGHHVSSTSVAGGTSTREKIRKTDHFVRTAPSPFDFTTQQLGKPVSGLLSLNANKIGVQKWEGRDVVVVEVGPVIKRNDYALKHRFWIDPTLGFAIVRRLSFEQRGAKAPWALHLQRDSRRLAEAAPGIWLPGVVEFRNYVTTEKGQGHLVSHDYLKTSNWVVNQPIFNDRLKLAPNALERIGLRASNVNRTPVEETAAAKNSTVEKGFREMKVRTVDEGGKPVAGTRIYVCIWPQKPYETRKADYFTDDKGECTVLMPVPPRLVRIWTQKSKYVPLFAQWWPKHQPDGHLIPDEFDFKLPTGSKMGGIIEDKSGAPIKNAIVEVRLVNKNKRKNDRVVPSIWLAEVPGPGKNPCISDENGRWSLENVPQGEDTQILVKLTHPDFVSDTLWGVSQQKQGVDMQSFRKQTARLVMHRGKVLSGRVSSPDGKPIKDALVVWGTDPYSQDGRQEVKTNANGEYKTAPLNVDALQVTVVAKGWRPELTSIEFQGDHPKADFRLKPGKKMRLHIVDDNGRPIPNVAVGISEWRGIKSLYNHIHPNVLPSGIPVEADAQGVFEWNWAPADEVKFWFFANGFKTLNLGVVAKEQVQTIMLNPDLAQEN